VLLLVVQLLQVCCSSLLQLLHQSYCRVLLVVLVLFIAQRLLLV